MARTNQSPGGTAVLDPEDDNLEPDSEDDQPDNSENVTSDTLNGPDTQGENPDQNVTSNGNNGQNSTDNMYRARHELGRLAFDNQVKKDLSDFIAEKCLPSPNDKVHYGVFKAEFDAWCNAKQKIVLGNVFLGRKLIEMGYEKTYAPQAHYIGLTWKPDSGIKNPESGVRASNSPVSRRDPKINVDKTKLVQEFIDDRLEKTETSMPVTDKNGVPIPGKTKYGTLVRVRDVYDAFVAWSLAQQKPGASIDINSEVRPVNFGKTLTQILNIPKVYANGETWYGGYQLVNSENDVSRLRIDRLEAMMEEVEADLEEFRSKGEPIPDELKEAYKEIKTHVGEFYHLIEVE